MIKSSDTRETILRAATRLFAQKGLGGTTTRDIAARAGVNIAALHYHWGGKEDLLRGVYQKVIEEVALLAMQITTSPSEDLRSTLIPLLTSLHDFFAANPDYARILMYEDLEDPDFLKELRQQSLIPIIQQISDHLRKLIRQKAIRKIDPEAALISLYAALMLPFIGCSGQKIMMGEDLKKSNRRFREQFIDLVLVTLGLA